MSALEGRLLRRLGTLRAGTTLCAGQLARDCGSTLRAAREEILALARSGRIQLRQRGRRATPETLKGPFRVCLPED